jgi:hypothetical protein
MARKRRPKGLGDTVEQITTATGIKAVMHKVSEITGHDCGCQQRKEFLNKAFPYVNIKEKCMDADQVSFYEEFKETYLTDGKSKAIPNEEVKKLVSLYNSVFQVNIKGCDGCNLSTYVKRLDNVYNKLKDGQT